MNGSEDSSREKLIRMSAYPKDNLYCLEPRGFRPEQKTGLFLFMHGGDRSTPKSAPYDNYIGPGGSLRPFLESLPFITAAPSAPDAPDGKRWNRPGCTEYLEAVIRKMESRYNIDQDRIIIGGYSMGGFGIRDSCLPTGRRGSGLPQAHGWKRISVPCSARPSTFSTGNMTAPPITALRTRNPGITTGAESLSPAPPMN